MSRKVQRVVAMGFDKRGRLLSVGMNSYHKTHPFQAKYSALQGNGDQIYIHAEIDALLKARNHVHKMVIARYGRTGNQLPSQPCSICLQALMDSGVEELEFLKPNESSSLYRRKYAEHIHNMVFPRGWPPITA